MPNLIVKSGVQEETGDFSVREEFYDELEEEVERLLEEAQKRAAENDRSTLMPRDV